LLPYNIFCQPLEKPFVLASQFPVVWFVRVANFQGANWSRMANHGAPVFRKGEDWSNFWTAYQQLLKDTEQRTSLPVATLQNAPAPTDLSRLILSYNKR
jgi:hypothetical protein